MFARASVERRREKEEKRCWRSGSGRAVFDDGEEEVKREDEDGEQKDGE